MMKKFLIILLASAAALLLLWLLITAAPGLVLRLMAKRTLADCTELVLPYELTAVCKVPQGDGVLEPLYHEAELCGKYWRSGGDLAYFHVTLYTADYYETSLTFDRQQAQKLGYLTYRINETNKLGTASYTLQTDGVNRLVFKQGLVTVVLHSVKKLCNLNELERLGKIVEKKTRNLDPSRLPAPPPGTKM